MDFSTALLNCYWETLHEVISSNREKLLERIGMVLDEEIERQLFEGVDQDRREAYVEACRAFIDERIETYNPIGIQYTFDQPDRTFVAEMEMQLDWYDKRVEFDILKHLVRQKAEQIESDEFIAEKAHEIIHEAGAFPDRSIIEQYGKKPSVQKLPDYVVSRVIEEFIHNTQSKS